MRIVGTPLPLALSSPTPTAFAPAITPSAAPTTAASTAAATHVLLLLPIDVGPRLLALLGHGVKRLVHPLGLDPSFARARAVGQHLVLCLHARAWDEVSLVARDVGNVVWLGVGALVSRMVDVVAAGEAVEKVLMDLLGVAVWGIAGLLAVGFAWQPSIGGRALLCLGCRVEVPLCLAV